VSKYAGERFCRMFHQSYGWPIVMLRPFNAYGPGQTPDRVIPEIIVRALRHQELKMTQGLQTREFNFVEDIAEGFVLAATTPGVEGEVLNLGCGEELSMRQVAQTILDLMGNPIEAQFGALPERPTEIHRMFCDSTKAREALGWAPRHSFTQGIEKTIAWYTEQLSDVGSPFFAAPRRRESP
jgi:nucleoside-diphosphate-sugar epimerase